MYYCQMITEGGISCLVGGINPQKGCRKLEYIDLSNCDKISKIGVRCLGVCI